MKYSAWEADVLPLNYTRIERHGLDISIVLSIDAIALRRVTSTKRIQTELSGAKNPVGIPLARSPSVLWRRPSPPAPLLQPFMVSV